MKILWLCNIVLPDFSREFGIKKNPFGGWMTGMLHQMEKREDVEICLCFPIFDSNRLKEGVHNGHEYYTFLCDMSMGTYTTEMVKEFERILEESKPDIVHIWGTEYAHSGAMLEACNKKNILDRAVINIQGLVSVYSKHYLTGIPEKAQSLRAEQGKSIEEEKVSFEKHGKYEIESIRRVRHVIGRTDWDRACVEAINPEINYYFCNEILRDIFYEEAGTWRYERCQKHSIFVSQASYPVKGFHYLLHALPIIVRKYSDTQVYVAGADILADINTNPYAKYLGELINQFKLSDHICFLGNLSEEHIIRQYRCANVFVCPSVIENSPNSLKEARLIGTPAVVSYVGGSYSELDFGIDAFLYPHNEPALMAYYICRVFENKDDLCTKLSESSTAKVLKKNNPEKTMECNVEIYKKIIENISNR